MIIAPAQSKHAESTCELIYQSGPASFDYIFNIQHGPEVRVFLRHLFRTRKTMFSHKHHLVCLHKDQVVGSLGHFSLKSHKKTFWSNACTILLHYGWRSIIKGIQFENRLVKAPKNDCLYLCHIAVKPEFRGKGIASRLILNMKALAKKEGYRALSLDVAQKNQTALNLYLSLGFKIISIQESYNSTLDNHIYMEMPL
ncbi:MAG: GNAT family N-acetyltransferase [Gammaproteobacteria bacterium]|nr:GNAT family N-acetyltransferase [Gammaproteobacteria bacterium]